MKKILFALILIIFLTGCGTDKAQIYGLYDKYEFDNLVFRNTDVKEIDNTYIITSTLTNKSDKAKNIKWFKLNVLLEDGIKNTIIVYFGSVIEPNQTLQTTTSVDFNANLIKSIDYEFN